MAVVSMNLDVNGVADWLIIKYFVKNAFNEAPKSPMTLSITTFSIMTLSIIGLFATLSINDT